MKCPRHSLRWQDRCLCQGGGGWRVGGHGCISLPIWPRNEPLWRACLTAAGEKKKIQTGNSQPGMRRSANERAREERKCVMRAALKAAINSILMGHCSSIRHSAACCVWCQIGQNKQICCAAGANSIRIYHALPSITPAPSFLPSKHPRCELHHAHRFQNTLEVWQKYIDFIGMWCTLLRLCMSWSLQVA